MTQVEALIVEVKQHKIIGTTTTTTKKKKKKKRWKDEERKQQGKKKKKASTNMMQGFGFLTHFVPVAFSHNNKQQASKLTS